MVNYELFFSICASKCYSYLTSKRVVNSFLIFAILMLPMAPAYAINVDEMLVNLQETIGPLTSFVNAFAYISGFFIMYKSLYGLKHYGDSRGMSHNADLRGAFAGMAVAACLLFLPSIITSAFVTVYGTATPTAYSSGSTGWDQMAETLVVIVQFVGGVAFVRGLFHFYKLGQGQAQQNTFGKAIVHIIGGIMALNIVGVKDILFSTLGIT